MGETRLDLAVTAHHRARINVYRLLRADEVATLVADLLAALRASEPARAITGAWGYLLLETTSSGPIDLLGLGVIAYRVLTGQMPQPNTRYVPGAPPPLASLIVRLLSADAKTRPTLRDADAALAVMLGQLAPIEPVEPVEEILELAPPAPAPARVDEFHDEVSPTPGGTLLRRPKWTPATHLAKPQPQPQPRPATVRPLKKL